MPHIINGTSFRSFTLGEYVWTLSCHFHTLWDCPKISPLAIKIKKLKNEMIRMDVVFSGFDVFSLSYCGRRTYRKKNSTVFYWLQLVLKYRSDGLQLIYEKKCKLLRNPDCILYMTFCVRVSFRILTGGNSSQNRYSSIPMYFHVVWYLSLHC